MHAINLTFLFGWPFARPQDEYLSDDVAQPHGGHAAPEDGAWIGSPRGLERFICWAHFTVSQTSTPKNSAPQTWPQRKLCLQTSATCVNNIMVSTSPYSNSRRFDSRQFITSLKNAMVSSNVAQIHNLYTSAFPRLTNEHFAQVEWPEVEVAQCLVDNNEVFGLFYRELYFRHIYSKLQPNIDDRFSSYENYCAIFNYILNSDGPVPIELPVQWLWDLVDEFVWQFASFTQWRSRPKGKTEDEIALLAENPQVWSCYSVLNVLYSLIQKSKIQDQLRAQAKGETGTEQAGEYGSKPLYRMLGLYSMVTLVRVHALLGDYTLALKMLDDVDMKKLVRRCRLE